MRAFRSSKSVILSLLIISIVFFSGRQTTYAADTAKDLPAPQLVTDAWMLIIGFEADPKAIKEILPPGLEPHPSNMVVMNMYTVPDASQTSGFGAYTLTYLTVQVKDQDSYIVGSKTGEPGRYFAFYFNSSELMRDFTTKVGIPAQKGHTTHTKKDGKLTSVLKMKGETVIVATADISGELQAPVGGHLNYFGLKKADSNGKQTMQIMKYPIPFLVRTVKTENPTVKFKVSKVHPLHRLKPTKVVWASYMKGSFVYPQAEVFK